MMNPVVVPMALAGLGFYLFAVRGKPFRALGPAFLVVVGIPFMWSIADGIAFGFIAYPALKLLMGRPRESSLLAYALGLLFLLRYALI